MRVQQCVRFARYARSLSTRIIIKNHNNYDNNVIAKIAEDQILFSFKTTCKWVILNIFVSYVPYQLSLLISTHSHTLQALLE